MPELNPGYVSEVDLIDPKSWDNLLLQFEDASYFQTWTFGAIHSGENSISHLVLKEGGRVVGMAQLRIVKAPGLRFGIAYVSSGPMHLIKNENYNAECLRNLLRALYIEYVLHRGLFLRIVPNIIDRGKSAESKRIYKETGYSQGCPSGQTVIVDLCASLDEIRKNMDRKWRQTLQSAERKNLEFIESSGDEVCQMALKIVKEMKNRKGFLGGNQAEAIRVHLELLESQKLRFVVCLDNNEPVAALGWVTTGIIGLPLVAATGTKALKTSASYVLWWKMIEYYKAHGFLAVDMGGIDKRRNPGGYYFKTHILGKRLNEQPRFIGPFDACENILSRSFFMVAHKTREIIKNLRS